MNELFQVTFQPLASERLFHKVQVKLDFAQFYSNYVTMFTN